MRFGAMVRNCRRHLGISQEELAWRAGMHRTYIADIERGGRNISLRNLDKLARALDVSMPQLLTWGESGQSSAGTDAAELVLVEDDQNDLDLALHALNEAQLSNPVRVLRDGGAALELFFPAERATPKIPACRPLVVLLDLNLPKVPGMEVLRRLKAERQTSVIPVAVLVSSEQDARIEEARRLGAEYHLVKPLRFENFSRLAAKVGLQWLLLRSRPGGRSGPVSS